MPSQALKGRSALELSKAKANEPPYKTSAKVAAFMTTVNLHLQLIVLTNLQANASPISTRARARGSKQSTSQKACASPCHDLVFAHVDVPSFKLFLMIASCQVPTLSHRGASTGMLDCLRSLLSHSSSIAGFIYHRDGKGSQVRSLVCTFNFYAASNTKLTHSDAVKKFTSVGVPYDEATLMSAAHSLLQTKKMHFLRVTFHFALLSKAFCFLCKRKVSDSQV
jgi:hypothetical protein